MTGRAGGNPVASGESGREPNAGKCVGAVFPRSRNRDRVNNHYAEKRAWKCFDDGPVVNPYRMGCRSDTAPFHDGLDTHVGMHIEALPNGTARLTRLADFRLNPPGQHTIGNAVFIDEIEASAPRTIKKPRPTGWPFHLYSQLHLCAPLQRHESAGPTTSSALSPSLGGKLRWIVESANSQCRPQEQTR